MMAHSDESLDKHDTCMCTIRPDFYGVKPGRDQNVYEYFDISINLYEKTPHSKAWIVPSPTQTYPNSRIADALRSV